MKKYSQKTLYGKYIVYGKLPKQYENGENIIGKILLDEKPVQDPLGKYLKSIFYNRGTFACSFPVVSILPLDRQLRLTLF
jgi:hypothetical protein